MIFIALTSGAIKFVCTFSFYHEKLYSSAVQLMIFIALTSGAIKFVCLFIVCLTFYNSKRDCCPIDRVSSFGDQYFRFDLVFVHQSYPFCFESLPW